LNQAVKDIASTIDRKGNEDKDKSAFEVFIIVQTGLDIGIFEYYNGASDLDQEGIDHLKGCVSLTQSILSYDNTKNSYGSVHRAVAPPTTAGLKRLMFDDEVLRTVENAEDRAVRDEAWSYQTPCIFNTDDHEVEIDLIIRYMLKG
jgi:hypothetical protein